jgi:tetratricopeptide (TPR) repeat protein
LIQRSDAIGFTGADLLAEEVGTAALLFWQAFRDVELWGRTTDRRDLFQPDGADLRADQIEQLDPIYGEVKSTLKALLAVVRNPADADPVAIADHCSSVAVWFESRGNLRCAVDFAVAAFFADSARAALAVRVARLTRMLAEYPRSTSWFDYSLYLARRLEDWQAYSEALLGLANLWFQVGNFPRARYYNRRCLRLVRRTPRLRHMGGAAYHNLFVLEMEAGNVELAETLAQKAFEFYGGESPCLVRLARDLSHRWTVLGYFARALPLALEALNHFSRPVDRAQVWAGVGRAAGGAGEFSIFEDAWIETWALVRQGLAHPFAADVLMDLAHGAASLRDLQRASHAATTALGIARERKEGHTILAAEALLDSLRPVRNDAAAPAISSAATPTASGVEAGLLRALQAHRTAA